MTWLWNKSSAYINRRDKKGDRKSCLVFKKEKVSYKKAYSNSLEFMNQLLNYSSAVNLPIVMFLIEPIAEKVAIVASNHKDFFSCTSSFFKGNKSSIRSNLPQNYFC